ncbi:NmrA-like family protein [Colletotrichum kahawae]|uniref:NmrA-like family protein n=1 Tax=Colletotrichum kahawae TaxID=34407 RepID=A0AAD9YGU7_COLKA|nr:NmrA-like family protein [Colletotrichum kahawae]
MAVPTFLFAGATGNTGPSAVETLSKLLQDTKRFAGHRILVLTRSSKGTVIHQLAKLPNVEITEMKWVDVSPQWLREQNVVRAFIAPHLEPSQFIEESAFYLALMLAGVEYVVRVSTVGPNIQPDSLSYYPRAHWAIEAMLTTPEFSALKWTSLQPNAFIPLILYPAVSLVQNFRKTGVQDTLKLMFAKDAPVGIIDPRDIGEAAAHLLVSEDLAKHNGAKYVLNGPDNITGAQVVKMVEEQIGEPVKHVIFKDMSFVEQMAAQSQAPRSIIMSIEHSQETAWAGLCSAATTSKEILEIAPPRRRPTDFFLAAVGSDN